MGRTVKEAELDLFEKFGLKDVSGFKKALKEGDIDLAKNWLQYIVDNRIAFPQFKPNWNIWLADREYEISQAKRQTRAA